MASVLRSVLSIHYGVTVARKPGTGTGDDDGISLEAVGKRFQVLALSGGGFRGLYTAQVIADAEREFGAPIARHFDLLAGTSVGGILALALAQEIPAQRVVDLFQQHGDEIFAKRTSLFGAARAPYTADKLRALLEHDDLFGRRLLGSCKYRVIVPAINYTTGEPVVFKTPHHPTLRRDHQIPLVEVALATSAAPGYFPRHIYENSQYVDGGLFANAPGQLALHEATEFCGADEQSVHLMAIGTMSAKFTVDPRRPANGGLLDWGGPRRLFGLAISAQEGIVNQMLKHRLGERYVHVDDPLTDAKVHAVQLDRTDAAAREVLIGSAHERSKHCVGDNFFQAFMERSPSAPAFFHGEHALKSPSSC
jgi:predicted acylesterase/phospholipase RssA